MSAPAVIRARVDSAITISRGDLSRAARDRLRTALSFANPVHQQRLRMGRRPGDEPETICVMEECGGELRIPRGSVALLREAAALDGHVVVFDDERVVPDVHLALPTVPLRDYQADVVRKLGARTQGYAVMPCGAGKTRTGIGAISRAATPALVLVHTLDLAEQWLDSIRELLGVEAGLVGDGEVREAPITVAVVQALARWERARLDSVLGGFGLLVVDESHHTAATIFRNVIDRCPARLRLGLTATPEREDGLQPLLDLYFGAPLRVVTHEELVQKGVLVVPTVRTLQTEFSYLYAAAEDYAPMLTALADDEARNQLIVDDVVREARAGNVCLVLSGRVEHCEHLAVLLARSGIRAAALTGASKRAERKALLNAARIGEIQVLVATTVADEGLDLPLLSRVFLAFPSRARGRTIQRIGRLMRPHPNKREAVLVDVVDGKVPILRRHYLERRRLYSELFSACAEAA